MKTLTFYSFKGGVGRSLTLSNMAIWLADEMKAKVCVIDFDLEAPGLPYKFEDLQNNADALQRLSQTEGIVEYVDEFKQTGTPPPNFERFYLQFNTHKGNPIQLIPAGNVQEPTYWDKLFNINWQDLFQYDPATGYSEGLLLLEDLKGRIQKELNPDFLLIDSRTGLTEIAAITLKLLADKIILVGINNRENQDGLFWVLRSLQADPTSQYIPFHLVLNRLPLKTSQIDPREQKVGDDFLKKFTAHIPLESLTKNFSIIHADNELAFEEKVEKGYIAETPVKAQMRKDYWDLFTKTLQPYFTEKEWEIFDNKRKAYNLYHAAKFSLIEHKEKIQKLNEAIRLCSEDDFLYLQRGNLYIDNRDFSLAMRDLEKAITLNPTNSKAFANIGFIQGEKKNYQRSIKYCQEAIIIDSNLYESYYNIALTYSLLELYQQSIEAYQKAIIIKPDDYEVYINMGVAYSKLGQYEHAIYAYQKAITINPNYYESYYNIGLTYSKLGQYQQSIEAYQKAIIIKPDLHQPSYNMAVNYPQLGEYKEVLQAYKKVL